MPVYWVQAGRNGLVKVGWADDVAKRIKQLQTGCPEIIILLRIENGERTLEATLHRYYRGKHHRAEWFALDRDDVAVDLMTLPPPRLRYVPKQATGQARARSTAKVLSGAATHADVILALGGPKDVAPLLSGVSANSVACWCKPGRIIPARFWMTLAETAAAQKAGITYRTIQEAAPSPGTPAPRRAQAAVNDQVAA